MKRLCLLLVFLALACESNRPRVVQTPSDRDNRIAAAASFTKVYAQSRFSGWNVRGSAAGPDCAILFVQTPVILEDSMIEAMHYGAGVYEIYGGGVEQFTQDKAFRGVAYKDGSDRVWTYGKVTPTDEQSLVPCERT